MNLSFANPALLAGLVLASIPLLIHLFDRRKARPLPFAAIEFVLRSQRRTSSRLKLRKWVLFALRTLLLLAIPFALARPEQVADSAKAAAAGPAATAVVIDGSLSMRWRDGAGSLHDRAKERARDLLARLSPDDPVTVLGCDGVDAAPARPTFDRGAVRRAIDEVKPSFRPALLEDCLARAAASLGESEVAGKRLVLISDLTASSLKLQGRPPEVATPQGAVRPEVLLIDATEGLGELSNLGITSLHIEPEPTLGARGFAFTFEVRNASAARVEDVAVALVVEGQIAAKGVVAIDPRGTARKTLSFRFPRGGVVHGQLELLHQPTGLAEDDVRPFVLRVPDELRALLVNGSPSSERREDGALFLETSLAAAGSPVRTSTVDVDTFASRGLAASEEPVAAVFLLGVPELPPDRVEELAGFVRRGGGLFISMGPRSESEGWTKRMEPLLPRKVRVVKTAVERTDPQAEQRAARFAQIRWSHPAFRVFTGAGREGFEGTRTYRYGLVEAVVGGESEVLASFDDGAPALLERRLGSGRVLMLTTSVDRSWSDFAIRTAFLPAMQRLAGWITGVLDDRDVGSTLLGTPHRFALTPGLSIVGVSGPDGRSRASAAAREGEGLEVAETDLPGLYRVALSGEGATALAGTLDFPVHVDPAEGDCTRLDPAAVQGWFGESARLEQKRGDEARRRGAPWWTALLVLGALLVLAEALVLGTEPRPATRRTAS